MWGTWRWIYLCLLTTMLLGGALACAKRTPTTQGPAAGGGGAAIRTRIPDPDELASTFEAIGGAQTTGTAALTPGSPGSKVVVELKQLSSGVHQAFIYHGSCEGAGEKHGPLSEIRAGSDGNATSTTNFLTLPLVHFLEEKHFVAVHAGPPDNPGAVVSCGEIVLKS